MGGNGERLVLFQPPQHFTPQYMVFLYTSKQHPVTPHRDELNRLWEYIYVLLNGWGRWQGKKMYV
jgi:hypothetical protein